MYFNNQMVLPAIKRMKDFEKVMESKELEYTVILEVHISLLESIMKYSKAYGKKIILHADLVQGLKNDKYSAEYLCQKIKPYGIISTRGAVLKTAKDNGIISIQRLFLLDTIALETSYKLARSIKPDFIEVLPGIIPEYIQKVHLETGIPVISGGLITKDEEIDRLLGSGAVAITTSREELWTYVTRKEAEATLTDS